MVLQLSARPWIVSDKPIQPAPGAGIQALVDEPLRIERDCRLTPRLLGWTQPVSGVLGSPAFAGDDGFNRLASLRDQDGREMTYAMDLPRNSPASCLREIADDLRQQMRQK